MTGYAVTMKGVFISSSSPSPAFIPNWNVIKTPQNLALFNKRAQQSLKC